MSQISISVRPADPAFSYDAQSGELASATFLELVLGQNNVGGTTDRVQILFLKPRGFDGNQVGYDAYQRQLDFLSELLRATGELWDLVHDRQVATGYQPDAEPMPRPPALPTSMFDYPRSQVEWQPADEDQAIRRLDRGRDVGAGK